MLSGMEDNTAPHSLSRWAYARTTANYCFQHVIMGAPARPPTLVQATATWMRRQCRCRRTSAASALSSTWPQKRVLLCHSTLDLHRRCALAGSAVFSRAVPWSAHFWLIQILRAVFGLFLDSFAEFGAHA